MTHSKLLQNHLDGFMLTSKEKREYVLVSYFSYLKYFTNVESISLLKSRIRFKGAIGVLLKIKYFYRRKFITYTQKQTLYSPKRDINFFSKPIVFIH